MYPSLKAVRGRSIERSGPWWKPVVTANVVYLGLTSLMTDVSSEMVTSIVPLFLLFQLGFTKFQLGVFNGAYQALAAFTALLGGTIADRHRRYKEVAGIGYGISAASRLGLAAAGTAWLPATAMLYADRAAKGIRTAPRDALISFSAVRGHTGEAFGVHRAMDTAGALGGPLLAFAILSAVPGGYGSIFRASFWIALAGCAVLVLLVRNPAPGVVPAASHRASLREAVDLLKRSDYRRLVCVCAALSLVTIADALVYLSFQEHSSMAVRFFPLLYVGTAMAYLVLALPLGRLADRVGPTRVFIGGQALLVIVDVLLLKSGAGPLPLLALLGALGTYYAATDGVLAVIATTILPDELRASGLALLDGVMALMAFAASTMFGFLWGWKSATFVVAVFLGGLLVTLVASLVVLQPLLALEATRYRSGTTRIGGA